MELTVEEYLNRIAARVVDNKEKLSRSLLQRRNTVTDLHGVEYTRSGGPGAPAVFYLSISTDMIYLSKFGFKLLISPYVELSPTSDPEVVPLDSSGYRVYVDDVDVSAYLAAQYNGWIGGEGIYPSLDPMQLYDLLEASSDLRAEGNIELAEKIVSPGYKKIEVRATSLFTARLQPSVTFSHSMR